MALEENNYIHNSLHVECSVQYQPSWARTYACLPTTTSNDHTLLHSLHFFFVKSVPCPWEQKLRTVRVTALLYTVEESCLLYSMCNDSSWQVMYIPWSRIYLLSSANPLENSPSKQQTFFRNRETHDAKERKKILIKTPLYAKKMSIITRFPIVVSMT